MADDGEGFGGLGLGGGGGGRRGWDAGAWGEDAAHGTDGRNKGRRKKQSLDDRMLGVFAGSDDEAEDDDDEEDDGSGMDSSGGEGSEDEDGLERRRHGSHAAAAREARFIARTVHGKPAGRAKYAAPVSFVAPASAGNAEGMEAPAGQNDAGGHQRRAGNAMDEDTDERPSFASASQQNTGAGPSVPAWQDPGAAASAEGGARRQGTPAFRSMLAGVVGLEALHAGSRAPSHPPASSKPAPPKPAAPASIPGIGEFEKHTKGFGSKILGKFGFKGRLGKAEQGISQPIAVQPRPEKAGLAYGDFREASHLPQNREVAEEFFGAEHAEVRRMEEAKVPTGRPVAKEGRPKPKEKKPKVQKKYKLASEVLASEAGESEPLQSAVIDMRGPQAVVVTSVAELGAKALEAADVGLGKELKHNLTILTDLAEVDLRTLNRRLKAATDDVDRLSAALSASHISAEAEALLADKTAQLHARLSTCARDAQEAAARLAADVATGHSAVIGMELLAAVLDDTLEAFLDAFSTDPYLVYRHNLVHMLPAALDMVLRAAVRACVTPDLLQCKSTVDVWRNPAAAFDDRLAALRRISAPLSSLLESVDRWRSALSLLHRLLGAAMELVIADAAEEDAALLQTLHNMLREGEVSADNPLDLTCCRMLLSVRAPRGWHEGDYTQLDEYIDVEHRRAATPLGIVLQRFHQQCAVALRNTRALLGAHLILLTKDLVRVWNPQVPSILRAWMLSLAPASCWDSTPAASASDLLPASDHTALLELVQQQLLQAVVKWNPDTDTVSVTDWLFPWIGHGLHGHVAETAAKGKHVAGLLAEPCARAREKVMAALSEWHPSDASAAQMLSAWRGVWDAHAFDQVLSRVITPRLRDALRALVINPADQDIDAFMWVVHWDGIATTAVMVALLVGEFFPKWLRIARTWVEAPGVRWEEVQAWYSGWKSVIPSRLLAHPMVQSQLHLALDTIDAALDGRAFPSLPDPAATSYESIHARLRQLQQKERLEVDKAGRSAPAAPPAPAPDLGVSFREAVESMAEAQGLALLPNLRKAPVEGNTVYSLGNVNVYFSGSVVFMEASRTGSSARWLPVSLSEFLRRAAEAR